MGLSYLLIGFFFLLNPNANVIDVLPDFIGYIFILKGLYAFSRVSRDFSDAYASFKSLLWISIVKLPLSAIALLVSESERLWLLVIAFIVGIFEAYFGYVAFSRYFEALAITSPNASEDGSYKPSVFAGYDGLRAFSLVFMILKPILACLPELALLSPAHGEVTLDGVRNTEKLYPFCLIAALIIGLVVGILWYVRARRHVKGILEDRTYLDKWEEIYQSEFAGIGERVTRARLGTILSLVTLGAIFSLKFDFDGVNYLPAFISASLWLAAILFIRKDALLRQKNAYPFALALTVVSFVYWICNLIFVKSFMVIDKNTIGLTLSYAEQLSLELKHNFTRIYEFIGLCVLAFLETVAMILVVRSLSNSLKGVTRNYTGHESLNDEEEALSSMNVFEEEEHRSLVVLSKFFGIFGYVCAVSDLVKVALSAILPVFWIADTLLHVGFLIVTLIYCSKLREAIGNKYYE